MKEKKNGADGLSRYCPEINRIIKNKICEIKQKESRNEIIAEYRIELRRASASNMYEQIKSKYYWQGQKSDLWKFVMNCKICLLVGKELINTKNRVLETER